MVPPIGHPAKLLIWGPVLAAGSFYLFWGTGVHGDDFTIIDAVQGKRMAHPVPEPLIIFGLPTYYLFWWAYYIAGEAHDWLYDLLKWGTHLAATAMVFRFAVDYLPPARAFLAALLFVFYPAHDATTYWYMAVPYVATPALIMHAHRDVRRGRLLRGTITGILGAFLNYASPPYTFGLAVVFAAERSYRKAVLFAAPGVLYVAFYAAVSLVQPGVERRIDAGLEPARVASNLLVQLISFSDATFGPSFALKLWWSAAAISLPSLLIAFAVAVLLVRQLRGVPSRPHRSLLLGLACVLLLALFMFALTGRYSQIAFNLGDRVTIYGSLLIAFLIASLPMRIAPTGAVLIAFLVPVFGLSDHWKQWNAKQRAVIASIRGNEDLARLARDDVVLVSGHMYSKLGPFSHIEFLCIPWVVDVLFDRVKTGNAMALHRAVVLDDGKLVDRKNGLTLALDRQVYVYMTEQDRVVLVPPEGVARILATRPPEIRHWVQLTEDGPVRKALLQLSPRLSHLFL